MGRFLAVGMALWAWQCAAEFQLPAAHVMDGPSRALLGDGQEVWDRVGFPLPPNVSAFFRNVTGIRASARTVPIDVAANGDGIHLVAIDAEPMGSHDDDSWYRVVRVGLAIRRGEDWEPHGSSNRLLQLPGVGKNCGNVHVDSLEPITVDGEGLTLLRYRYSDSISTPRGQHEVSVLLDISDSLELRVCWYFETGYRFSGAGLGLIEERTEITIRDVDQDATDEIVTTTKREEQRVWRQNEGTFEQPE